MAVQVPRRLASELLRLSRPRPCARCLFQAPELRSFHSAPARCRASQSTVPKSAPKPSSHRAKTGNGGSGRSTAATLTALAGGGILLSTGLFALSAPSTQDHADQSHPPASSGASKPTITDDRDPSLPRFRLADVRKHDAKSEHPWVTHGDKIYDITDWVGAHPGGEVILRSAGGSIDPYWAIFRIHQQPYVREILAQYLIGLIDTADLGADGQPAAESIEDPFAADPARDARLITHTAKPRNAECPPQALASDFLTPNELFYVRNHMWVPVVDAATAGAEHTLTVELPDGESRVYTLDELRERFPMHRVTAVMQCSGNRRSDMNHVKKTNGLQWGAGAISNAEWEGVRLADVLADAGLKTRDSTLATVAKKDPEASGGGRDDDAPPDADSLHVQFSGLETYGASIPLPAALDPRGDVLLAMRMNGEPIPRDHGFPLRAVVPGCVAARSVKWLSKILVSDEESPSQWQRRDYKCFGPNVGANPDWDSAPAIQEMPVTSAITGVWVGECVRKSQVPWMGAAVQKLGLPAPETEGPKATTGLSLPKDGQTGAAAAAAAAAWAEPLALQGYAYSGGGREVVRVDVSADGGRTCGPGRAAGRQRRGGGEPGVGVEAVAVHGEAAPASALLSHHPWRRGRERQRREDVRGARGQGHRQRVQQPARGPRRHLQRARQPG